MTLNEYIKMFYKRPNRKVLEGLGASEDLIEYLMETPGNTNLNVVDSITNPGGGGDTGEVWFVGSEYTDDEYGRTFTLSKYGDTDHSSELIDNAENYDVYLNSTKLLYSSGRPGLYNTWSDNGTEENFTKYLAIDGSDNIATYADASTAPTSVEVSVKAK